MKRPVDAVIEFLQSEMDRGKTHVLLDESARDGLRDLYIRSHPKTRAAKAAANPAPSGHAPASDRGDETTSLQVLGDTREQQLATIHQQAGRWAPALRLGTLRSTLVFSDGDPHSKLMLIGEAPGYEEERQGLPFVGPAGQKLNDILKAMGLPREKVYISNIVKFRPSTPRQTTNNRKPTPEEILACLPIIQAEIDVIRPECIIALGGTAAEGLLGLSGTVTGMRNAWHTFGNIPVRVTYHPSYLLQSGANLSVKRQVWEDMLAVLEQLNLPISEKQRNFFLPKTGA